MKKIPSGRNLPVHDDRKNKFRFATFTDKLVIKIHDICIEQGNLLEKLCDVKLAVVGVLSPLGINFEAAVSFLKILAICFNKFNDILDGNRVLKVSSFVWRFFFGILGEDELSLFERDGIFVVSDECSECGEAIHQR